MGTPVSGWWKNAWIEATAEDAANRDAPERLRRQRLKVSAQAEPVVDDVKSRQEAR